MRQHFADLNILFPTSFSDACFRTARAIAQIADKCHISLTLVHVCRPGMATTQKRRELDSFMAEADHYDSCRRILIESEDPVEAIGQLCDEEQFDLILAPASDRLGLHRVFTLPFRSRLLKRCNAPVWTAGKCLDSAPFRQRLECISCVLDFDAPDQSLLRLASALAWRTGARLRLTAIIEPVSEATLARSLYSKAPLLPEAARQTIREIFRGQDCPEIDVAVGDTASELPKLLQACDTDLVLVGPHHALDGVLSTRLASHLDRLPCPVVCVDGGSASFHQWSFERTPSRTSAASPLLLRAEHAVAS